MFLNMASRTESDKVRESVVALMTALSFVMNLQVLEGPTPLTPPVVPLEDQLGESPVRSYPQLDPFDLLQHVRVVSVVSVRPFSLA